MRRKDREVKSKDEIRKIIDRCDVCRLAMSDEGMPYIVPMNFGYECENDEIIFYFHCAKEGRKLDILKRNPNICIEMDCSHEIVTGENACSYSMMFESVIGFGTAAILTEENDKIKALQCVMAKLSDRKDFEFEQSEVKKVMAFKIKVSDITAKRAQKH